MSKKLVRIKTYNVKPPKNEIELLLESVFQPIDGFLMSKNKKRSIEANIMDNEFQEIIDKDYLAFDQNLDNINDEVYQVFPKLQWAEQSEKECYLNEMFIERENEHLMKLLEIEAEKNELRNKILEDEYEGAKDNLKSDDEIDMLNENMMNEIANNLENGNGNADDCNDRNEEELENEIVSKHHIKSYTGDFNLISLIMDNQKNKNKIHKQPSDDDELLIRSNRFTKGELCRELDEWTQIYNIKQPAVNELLSILHNLIPDISWPLRTTTTGDTKSIIDNYAEKDLNLLEFHICPAAGCCAFVADNAYARFCVDTDCNAKRFRKCTHINCEKKLYEECNHSMKNAISNKSLFYRSIILLLNDLLSSSGFIHAINYIHRDKTKTYQYIDISNGSTYRKHLREMERRYNEKNPDKKHVMINLLLGQFYDGCQVFKNQYSVFWPMNIYILNLPPSYRIKLGLGMFLVSVFTAILASNSEDFFLRSLMVGELKALYDGVAINVKGISYFVQVRMILTILDTVAVYDFLKVSPGSAYTGCFMCRHGIGYRGPGNVIERQNKKIQKIQDINDNKTVEEELIKQNNENSNNNNLKKLKSKLEILVNNNDYKTLESKSSKTNKRKFEAYEDDTGNIIHKALLTRTVIIGHRQHLDLRHYCRHVGQSQKCCPPNYYKPYEKNAFQFVSNDDNTVKRMTKKNKFPVCDSKNTHFITEYIGNLNEEWKFYHTGYYTQDFENDLWYHNCDYRPKQNCERKKNKDYIESGKKAKELNFTRKTKKVIAVNGVKDVWAMADLEYTDIEEQLCWGPLHSLMNVADNIIKNWKGERIKRTTYDVINYCKASGTHPMLYKTKAEIKETDDSNKMKQNKNITENKVKGEKRNRNVNKKPKKNVKKKPKKKNKTNNKVRGEKTNKNIVTKIKPVKPVHVVPKKLKDSNNKGKSKETSGWGLKWEIKNDTQHLIEAFVLALNVPKGCSGNIQCSFMFQRTGNLRAMGEIQIISVLMPLICTLLALDGLGTKKKSIAYLAFWMMLYDDFNDLLSPKFRHDKQIDALHKRVLETICLHEGLYPISESTLCWHQLLDITSHIKKFGPIKGFWECSGERSLKTIKAKLPKGGLSYDKSVMLSYSKLENVTLKQSYCFEIDDIYNIKSNQRTSGQNNTLNNINNFENFSVWNNKMMYTDEKFFLMDAYRIQTDCFNHVELSFLLTDFITEIKKRSENFEDAATRSPLFRLYIAYLYHNDPFNKNRDVLSVTDSDNQKPSFFNFFINAIDAMGNNNENSFITNLSDYEIFFDYTYIQMLTVATTEGTIFSEDLEKTKILFSKNFNPHRYSKALVYGIEMKSRGVSCAEKEFTKQPSLKCNDLSNSWWENASISSWFKFHMESSLKLHFRDNNNFGFSTMTYDSLQYGQFNYFFRLDLPDEPLLDGLPMASATCRETLYDHYIDTVKTDKSSYEQKRFVSLTNVCSTRILVGARDNQKQPIAINNDFNQQNSEAANRQKYLSKELLSKAADLYFLDLDPQRKTVHYDKFNQNYYLSERNNN